MPFNIHISIPQNYNDLSVKQLENISFLKYQQQGLSKELKGKVLDTLNQNIYYKVVRELLRGNGFIKLYIALREIPVALYEPFSAWVFQKVDRTQFPKRIKAGRSQMYGPADRMSNLTVGEFSFADALWYHWHQTNKKGYLDLLCATLYRPLSENAERVGFTKLLAEDNGWLFQKVPLKKKLAVALAYEGSRNHKTALYPNVFVSPAPISAQDVAVEQRPKKYTPFGKLIAHKIQYDPSKLNQVENMLIDKFLGIYENELKELKKRK